MPNWRCGATIKLKKDQKEKNVLPCSRSTASSERMTDGWPIHTLLYCVTNGAVFVVVVGNLQPTAAS